MVGATWTPTSGTFASCRGMVDAAQDPSCRAEDALALVQGKWKVAILNQLKRGPIRFGALQRSVAGISHKVLTQELKALVDLGIVSRMVRAEAPILNVDYTLTPFGEEVEGLLCDLDAWSRGHLPKP